MKVYESVFVFQVVEIEDMLMCVTEFDTMCNFGRYKIDE